MSDGGYAMHYRIAQVLRARLASGKWQPGSAPATERQLCEEFGASRTTVRQALEQLKRDGLLRSRTGVGTHSVRTPVSHKVVRTSGDPLHAALSTRPRVVDAGEVPATPAVAAFFGIAAGDPVWHFVRVHALEGRPISVVDSYLPARLGAAFKRSDLRRPMQALLRERYGLRLHRSVHAIRVARADVDVARALGIALADPVLQIQSSVYLADGSPIRWTDNHFREDAYEYVAEMRWRDPHDDADSTDTDTNTDAAQRTAPARRTPRARTAPRRRPASRGPLRRSIHRQAGKGRGE